MFPNLLLIQLCEVSSHLQKGNFGLSSFACIYNGGSVVINCIFQQLQVLGMNLFNSELGNGHFSGINNVHDCHLILGDCAGFI